MAYNQYNSHRENDRVRYELKERIGVLGVKDNGWTKEVNIVSWNGGDGKVDIRDWDPSHVRMAKGITMREEEAEKLAKVLAKRYGIGQSRDASKSSYSSHRSEGYKNSGNSGLYDVAESNGYAQEGRAAESSRPAFGNEAAESSGSAFGDEAAERNASAFENEAAESAMPSYENETPADPLAAEDSLSGNGSLDEEEAETPVFS